MSDGQAALDAHAYVDNCLSAAERSAFEEAMRRDPKLRARVEAWQAQNEAIDLAFGAEPRVSPGPSRAASVKKIAIAKMPVRQGSRAPAEVAEHRGLRLTASAAHLLRAAVFVTAFLGLQHGLADPREALLRRAPAALRVASVLSEKRLDLASGDPNTVASWLGPRIAVWPAARLSPPGWSLRGVRLDPGLESAAALVLFEDATGDLAGLILERTDAAPDLPPVAAPDADQMRIAGVEESVAYAAIGPKRAGVAALVPEPKSTE